jgi:DnaA family protein
VPQLPLSLVPPRRRRFDNFVAGPNAPVVDALRHGLREGQWLFVRGPAGSGKSHLAEAAVHEYHDAGRSACFVPAREPAARGLLDGRDPALAVVDDIEQLAGDAGAERALFNALNRWRSSRTAVLLTGSGAGGFVLPDLASRLGQAARLTLEPLRDDDLARLIDRLVDDFRLVPGRGLADYLQRHGPRSPARLVALFERMARRAQAERRVVSVPLAREELAAEP